MSIVSKHRRGQALIMVTLGLVAMAGMLGFAVDLGYTYFRKQALQSVAEAASLAAAQKAFTASTWSCGSTVVCQAETACPNPVPTTLSPTYNNVQDGCYYASVYNSFATTGAQKVTMEANTTPATPPTIAPLVLLTQYWVTARASESILQPFSSVMGNSSMITTARATAAVVRTSLAGCLNVLDKTNAAGTLTTNGSVIINSPTCNILVNSPNAQAVQLKGAGSMNANTLGVAYVGAPGCASPGCGVNISGNKFNMNRTQVATISSFPDPLASTPTPAPPLIHSTCDFTNYHQSVGKNSTITLAAGTYCGGIQLSGSGTANFGSGIYTLLGGGLSVTGTSVTGTAGVGFYNTFNATYAFQPITITGGGIVDLVAPSTSMGAMAGMLFFEDRSVPVNTYTNTITGNTGSSFTGAMYFRNSTLSYQGTSTSGTQMNMAVVANRVSISGNGTVNMTSVAAPEGAPIITKVYLVE